MGERLVFDIYRGHDDHYYQICSIHFHWSAYTMPVYREAKMLIDGLKRYNYNQHMTDHETIQMLIDIVQNNVVVVPETNTVNDKGEVFHIEERKLRGGVSSTSEDYAREKGYKFETENVSRSYGLIGSTDESIESMHEWAEDIEDFYIDDEFFTNGLFSDMTLQEINDENFGIGIDINRIPPYDVWKDPTCVDFKDVDAIIEWLDAFGGDWIIGKYEENGILHFVTVYSE